MGKEGQIIHCNECGFYARYNPRELFDPRRVGVDITAGYSVSLRHEAAGFRHVLEVTPHPWKTAVRDQGPPLD